MSLSSTLKMDDIPPQIQQFFFSRDTEIYSHFEPEFHFNYLQFQKMLKEIPWGELNKKLEDLRKFLKNRVGYFWDSGTIKFTDLFGHPYTFALGVDDRNDSYHSVTIWDGVGNTAIYQYMGTRDKAITIEEIEKAAELYSRGFVHCSRCNIEFPWLHGHHIFAAIYCSDCWHNHGMKEQEARTNYD